MQYVAPTARSFRLSAWTQNRIARHYEKIRVEKHTDCAVQAGKVLSQERVKSEILFSRISFLLDRFGTR
jgi:hypothetical protein